VTHLTERDRELILDGAWDLPMAQAAWIAEPDALRARAEQAGASGVTELLYTPSGPDPVGEAGQRLSGGQRQMVALARVTASEYARPAAGVAEARQQLGV